VGFGQRESQIATILSKSLSAKCIIYERKLLHWRKTFLCSNITLKAILRLVRCCSANVDHQYGVDSVCSVSKDSVKHTVWQTFSVLVE